MNIGKPVKVTEEPRPIRLPEINPRREPARIPEREPVAVPARRVAVPGPARTFPGGEIFSTIASSSLPDSCPRCGRELEESGIFDFILSCPKHGVVLRSTL